ncbi:MAG: HAD family hydrolase [Promethearchaeota archaeon]|jgi:phosphoglycolate phosphatase
MTIKDVFSLESKKVIVFDLDGTVVRLSADWYSLLKALNARYRKKYKTKVQFNRVSALLNEIVAKRDEEELKQNFSIIQRYELENITKTELIEDVIYFIDNLDLFEVNTRAKLAIFSLNTRATIIKSLQIAGVLDEFALIVGRDDVRAWKPEPEGLLKIKDHFQVQKEDMIYFGDLTLDLLAGENAGIQVHIIDELINYIQEFKKIKRIT